MKAAEPRLVKLVALAPTDYAFESALGHIRVAQGIISRSVTRAKNTEICNLTKFTGNLFCRPTIAVWVWDLMMPR